MILKFKLENYRSYKRQIEFTMTADTARAKEQNYFEIPTFPGSKKKIKILKTAVIYGANASGKSNIVKAINDLIEYILEKPKITEVISIYEPFRFAAETLSASSSFEITFMGPSDIKYLYSLTVSRRIVLKEKLDYYPEGKSVTIFERRNQLDKMINGSNYKVEEKDLSEIFELEDKTYKIFKNQLLLSSFSSESHPILTGVYLYFENNFQERDRSLSDQAQVSKQLLNDKKLKDQLTQLLKAADTKIKGIHIVDVSETLARLRKDSELSKSPTFEDYFIEFTIHDFYEGGKVNSDPHPFQLSDESQGSRTLYTLGTKILKALQGGKTFIYDELDTSLHSYVTKMLTMLFLSPKINKKNAQLIFTTHDTSLLDKDLLRKDQIWFAERDETGTSDFYSLGDFDNLREDIPFDKWYMAGKFGGLPNIGEIESIFEGQL